MTSPTITPYPSMPPLVMSSPQITDADIAEVTAVLRTGCLSLGPKLEEFEDCFRRFTGLRHAVAVSSGTAGLHLAIVAAGIGADDLVITTPFSFVASANCLLYEHAEPVFVDVDADTGNIDPALVEAAVCDLRTGGHAARPWLSRSRAWQKVRPDALKGVLPVHVFGQPAEMDRIRSVAGASDLVVIEDACEAVASEYKGRRAGTLGDAAVLAFYPNKQMTTGEGGMLLTDRDDWAEAFRSLRNQGRDQMDAWLRHDRLGYNYRLDELSAALGVAQFARLDALVAARDRVARWYQDRLIGVELIEAPRVVSTTSRMSWFAYVVRLHAAVDRQAVMTGLAAAGVPSRPYFQPIHLQPFFMKRFGYKRGDFPVAEALGDSCLALPFSGTMTEQDVDRVCCTLIPLVQAHIRRSQVALSITV